MKVMDIAVKELMLELEHYVESEAIEIPQYYDYITRAIMVKRIMRQVKRKIKFWETYIGFKIENDDLNTIHERLTYLIDITVFTVS